MDARPFDLILFDLDGTLVETAPEIADAVNDTLTALGHAPVAQKQVDDWIGHGTRELLIKALAQALGAAPEAVRAAESFGAIEAEFGRHYQARCGTRSHLYPRVRESLEALRAAGVKLAVVTNKEGRYTQTVLDVHALTPLFDRVISGDTLAVKKPEPGRHRRLPGALRRGARTRPVRGRLVHRRGHRAQRPHRRLGAALWLQHG
jgi:phosphoglycolate phosphatase